MKLNLNKEPIARVIKEMDEQKGKTIVSKIPLKEVSEDDVEMLVHLLKNKHKDRSIYYTVNIGKSGSAENSFHIISEKE